MTIDKPKSPFKPENPFVVFEKNHLRKYEKPLQEFIDRMLPHKSCLPMGKLRKNWLEGEFSPVNEPLSQSIPPISTQDIANAGVKVDDLDNYHMLVRDLVEEKPKHRRIPEKSETPWYSRMAPMDANFGVKSFNKGDNHG